jgi:hypothetical protein
MPKSTTIGSKRVHLSLFAAGQHVAAIRPDKAWRIFGLRPPLYWAIKADVIARTGRG